MKKGTNRKLGKPAVHPTIGRLVRKTAGGRHGIYEATLKGEVFNVRKPLQ
jgi:hypothetical protein